MRWSIGPYYVHAMLIKHCLLILFAAGNANFYSIKFFWKHFHRGGYSVKKLLVAGMCCVKSVLSSYQWFGPSYPINVQRFFWIQVQHGRNAPSANSHLSTALKSAMTDRVVRIDQGDRSGNRPFYECDHCGSKSPLPLFLLSCRKARLPQLI